MDGFQVVVTDDFATSRSLTDRLIMAWLQRRFAKHGGVGVKVTFTDEDGDSGG